MSVLPKYPIFVPTKGRWETPLTIRFLQQDEVPFRIVVRANEIEHYAKLVAADQILVLPPSVTNLMETRNWVRDVAEQEGHARHWQLDDNIRRVYRLWYGQRIPCDSGPALREVEDFSDRWTNVGISGLNYKMFGLPNLTAYFLNAHVYSCTLVNHAMPFRWRLIYNDDTDLCLQALAGKWCTVLCNVFLADKLPTMVVKGGNTDELYKIGVGAEQGKVVHAAESRYETERQVHYVGTGRLAMARALEDVWGNIGDLVVVDRRFQRAQHVIDWRRFKFPLLPREDFDESQLPAVDEYGLELKAVSEIRSSRIQQVLVDWRQRHADLAASA